MKKFKCIASVLLLLSIFLNCSNQHDNPQQNQQNAEENFKGKQDNGLLILTEEDPPYSFTGDDGEPAGFAVEVTSEIMKRIGSTDKINVVPWARAYKLIQEKKDVVVFSMSRTAEREDLFQWVGPIVENDWVFIVKKDSKLKINNLEEAKKVNAIGSVREYAWTKYLEGKGFTNIEAIDDRKQNVLKLNADLIDKFLNFDSSYRKEIEENGLNPDDYKILYRFYSVQMYIAHSKNTDPAIVNKWQKAFEQMIADGSFKRIHKRWLPNNKLPRKTSPEK